MKQKDQGYIVILTIVLTTLGIVLLMLVTDTYNSRQNKITEARIIIEDTYCEGGNLSHYDGKYNIIICCKDILFSNELSKYIIVNKKEYLIIDTVCVDALA